MTPPGQNPAEADLQRPAGNSFQRSSCPHAFDKSRDVAISDADVQAVAKAADPGETTP
jgi:hypothetical protein